MKVNIPGYNIDIEKENAKEIMRNLEWAGKLQPPGQSHLACFRFYWNTNIGVYLNTCCL